MSDSVRPQRRQPIRLPRPWDSPGKNTGVGCRFLLQCIKVKSESEVAQLCPTLSNPMDCSLPGSSIHGIFQARVLQWVAIAFSAKPAKVTISITMIGLSQCNLHCSLMPMPSHFSSSKSFWLLSFLHFVSSLFLKPGFHNLEKLRLSNTFMIRQRLKVFPSIRCLL